MALNAAIATVVPESRSAAGRARADAGRRDPPRRGARVGACASSSPAQPCPFALQAIYLVCLPLAARGGVGDVTSFGYAYLIGAAVVAVAASSLGLVTSVPLTRAGIDGRRVATHVDASSWLALLAIGATAGIFAIAGSSILRGCSGTAYGTDVGEEIGLLVVALAPWMVMSVGVSVTFPLVFVAGRGSRLPRSRSACSCVHVPLAFVGAGARGALGPRPRARGHDRARLRWMLVLLDALAATLGELAVAAGTVAALVVAAFGLAALLLDDGAAAAAGTALSCWPSPSCGRPGCAPPGRTSGSSRERPGRGRRAHVGRPRADARCLHSLAGADLPGR